MALTACGGSSDAFQTTPSTTGAGSPSASAGGQLTVGGATFTEMKVMQRMYGELLTKAGYTVDYKDADNREIYFASLKSGEIDVVPEYAATMTEFLNLQANGKDAKTIATNEAASTIEAAKPLAQAQGVTFLEPAKAADQNGFAVTKEFADKNKVTSLSELAGLGKPVRLAATAECKDRPFCAIGLKDTYGLDIASIQPLGFGTPQAKKAVTSGKADLVLTGTTDGTLEQLGLVLLEDDKGLQLADNLVPVVNTESAGTPAVAEVLNKLAGVLTTEDLAALNLKVDAERQKPEDVAKEYLQSKGLL